MKSIYVPTDPHDKAMQRALMQWKRPEKRALVLEALRKTHREDLIGFNKHCLLRPNGGAGKPASPAGRGQKPNPRGRKPAAAGRGDSPRTAPPSAPKKKAGWAAAKPKKNARPGKGKKH